MKLKKSQIKEFIRHSIYEILSEEDVKDKTIKYKDDEGNEKEATVGGILKKGEDHPAYKDAKAMVDKDSGKEEPEAKKTTISANPFAKDDEKEREPETDYEKRLASFGDPADDDDDDEDDEYLQPAEAAFDKIDDFMSDHEGDIPDEYTDALENIQDDLQNAGDDQEVAELESKAEKIMNDIEQMGIKGEFDKETSTEEKFSSIAKQQKNMDKMEGKLDDLYKKVEDKAIEAEEKYGPQSKEAQKANNKVYAMEDALKSVKGNFMSNSNMDLDDVDTSGNPSAQQYADMWKNNLMKLSKGEGQFKKLSPDAKNLAIKFLEKGGIEIPGEKEQAAEKPSEDWKNDEQAWADQWDQVQSDYQEWKDNIEDTKREFEDDPSDENRENYEDDKEELKKAREKFLAFQKVGRENDWLEESIKESIHESVKPRRSTVKEIKTWMKTLEENRYRKIVQADARRVAWFVNNNLAEDYEQMPKSIRKKWSRANYGRERYLAKEFMKHKKSEQKLREMVRESIMDLVTEAKVEIAVDLKDFNKVKKIVKKIKGELVKHPFAKKTFGVKVDKNMYDKALEFLMKNKIDVRG